MRRFSPVISPGTSQRSVIIINQVRHKEPTSDPGFITTFPGALLNGFGNVFDRKLYGKQAIICIRQLTFNTMNVHVDDARHDKGATKVNDLGLWSCETFNTCIFSHIDESPVFDRNSLGPGSGFVNGINGAISEYPICGSFSCADYVNCDKESQQRPVFFSRSFSLFHRPDAGTLSCAIYMTQISSLMFWRHGRYGW